jgi:phosphatidylglycerophosphate synthase
VLDARLRHIIDPALDNLASQLIKTGISANAITICGFLVGLAAIPFIALHFYHTALVLILFNRLMDGLDGAVAKQTKVTDLGAYLDIVLDFIFYSAVIFGFALAMPEKAIYASFLILSFIGTGSSFLAFAIFAEKRQITTDIRGKKSLYYLGGLTEGTETILLFILLCLYPAYFSTMALVFAMMCWMTTLSRICYAWIILRSTEKQ